jgi:hypothetical protein
MEHDQEWEPLQALPCDEEAGNEIVEGTGTTAHTTMLTETGQCPWCGEEA